MEITPDKNANVKLCFETEFLPASGFSF